MCLFRRGLTAAVFLKGNWTMEQLNNAALPQVMSVATKQFAIVMTQADGTNILAVGSVAANAKLITGTLQRATFNALERSTVWMPERGVVRRGLLAAGEDVVSLAVPLTLTDDGELEVGGAGIEIGMPLELKTAPAGKAAYIGFRWTM